MSKSMQRSSVRTETIGSSVLALALNHFLSVHVAAGKRLERFGEALALV
jgi:hypothetical protein